MMFWDKQSKFTSWKWRETLTSQGIQAPTGQCWLLEGGIWKPFLWNVITGWRISHYVHKQIAYSSAVLFLAAKWCLVLRHPKCQWQGLLSYMAHAKEEWCNQVTEEKTWNSHHANTMHHANGLMLKYSGFNSEIFIWSCGWCTNTSVQQASSGLSKRVFSVLTVPIILTCLPVRQILGC